MDAALRKWVAAARAGCGLRRVLGADRAHRPRGDGAAGGPALRDAVRGYGMVVVTLIGNGLLFPPRRRAQRGSR